MSDARQPSQGSVHLHAMFHELRNARDATKEHFKIRRVIKRHPIAVSILAVVGGMLLARLLFGGRRGERDQHDSIGGAFMRSIMGGMARSAGSLVPSLLSLWMVHKARAAKSEEPEQKGI